MGIIHDIVDRKRLDKYRSDISLLLKLERENGLPKYLLVSILLIETKCRPITHRCAEYGVLFLSVILNLVIRKSVKNYTVGKCQLGIACILNYYGENIYHHIERIHKIGYKEIAYITRALWTKDYYQIFVHRVSSVFRDVARMHSREENTITHIGEQFNGQYTYGITLVEVVKHLEIMGLE